MGENLLSFSLILFVRKDAEACRDRLCTVRVEGAREEDREWAVEECESGKDGPRGRWFMAAAEGTNNSEGLVSSRWRARVKRDLAS